MLRKNFLAILAAAGLFIANLAFAEDKSTDDQKIKIDVKTDKSDDNALNNYESDMHDEDYDEDEEESNEEVFNNVQGTIKGNYKNYNITIHIYDGKVTLTGNVDSDKDKKDIENKVKNVQGVKEVKNDLKVKG